MDMFVKVIMPSRLSSEDLSWLLDNCDSMVDGNVCRCVSCEEFESLITSLRSRGFEHEVLDEKPVTKPLGKYVRMILSAWLRDQEHEWRRHRFP